MQWPLQIHWLKRTRERQIDNPRGGIAFAVLAIAAAASISIGLASAPAGASGTPETPKSAAASSTKPLSPAQITSMNSAELTKYVFENHGCKTCHTLSADWKLGFSERGKQLASGFEGCPSLLTSMNVIAQVEPAERTAEEKAKAAKFQQFGCTTCHQIIPGQMALTSYGKKLKSLHLPGCTTDL